MSHGSYLRGMGHETHPCGKGVVVPVEADGVDWINVLDAVLLHSGEVGLKCCI